jgi:SAM-dependent methyltransferase
MTTLSPDQRPDGWSRTSAEYNEHVWDFMEPFVAAMLERAELDSAHAALDVAAGSGAVTMQMAPKVRSVLSTDFAEGMLDELRNRVSEAGVDNVEVRQMDGQALDLADESVDRVCSNFGLIFFPDRHKGFSEMRRVLRPGGRAVVSGWCGPDRFEVFGVFVGAVRAALPDRPAPAAPPPVFSLASSDQFEKEMKAAGFEEVRIDTIEHGFDIDSPEAFWELMSTSAPPAVFLLESVGPDDAKRIRDQVLSDLRARFGDGAFTLNNAAHLGIGIR